ncbi:MAG: hypothetical protein ACXV3V_09920, partial [Actinomycetes bacterium]
MVRAADVRGDDFLAVGFLATGFLVTDFLVTDFFVAELVFVAPLLLAASFVVLAFAARLVVLVLFADFFAGDRVAASLLVGSFHTWVRIGSRSFSPFSPVTAASASAYGWSASSLR